jgi:hypothetical protein
MIVIQPTCEILFFGPEPFAPFVPVIDQTARWRFLEDHLVGKNYIQAGSELNSDGGLVPLNWAPTPNVEPLNSLAVTAFYAAGPRDLGLVRQQWSFISVPQPITFWKQISPNLYILTGLGSALPSKFAVIFHPVGNIPQ